MTADVRAGVVRQSGLTSVAATVAIASGLALDLTIATLFGASGSTDAFVAAARIPLGILAMLMATANQVLVPAFSAWMVRHEQRQVSQLASTVLLAAMLAGLLVAGVLAAVAAPLTALIAPGFTDDQQRLAAELTRVFVCVVPLTAGSEVLRSYLNARYSFVAPAAMTVVLNVVATAVLLTRPGDISIVPIAYVLGGLIQFLVMCAVACRRGLRFCPTASLRLPELAEVARLTPRPLLAASLNPAARVVELLFASFLPTGAATIIHYGNRLVSAIGGTVLFRSVVVAVVPRLSRAEAHGRRGDVARLVVLSLRIMLALSLPVTAALAVLAVPGARLAFEHGRFDGASATLLGMTLMVYAASFVGSAVQRALLAPFFARRDTITPLRNTVYGVAANIALLPLLVLPLSGTEGAVLALAAAYSISQYVHVAHALRRLRQDLAVDLSGLAAALLRSVTSAAAAAGVMTGTAVLLNLYSKHSSSTSLLAGLLLSGGLGLMTVAAGELLGGRGLLRRMWPLRRPKGHALASERTSVKGTVRG